MRKVVYERFHGLKWIALSSNMDVPPRTAQSTFSDYSPDLDSDSSVERIIEDAYTHVASKLRPRPPPRSRSTVPAHDSNNEAAYIPMPEVMARWARGRVVRYPAVQRPTTDVLTTVRSGHQLPPSVTVRAHRTARARLRSVFTPAILAQLDSLGKRGRLPGPKLRMEKGTGKEKGGSVKPLPSMVRRKYYGRWYLPTSQWASAMSTAVHRSSASLSH